MGTKAQTLGEQWLIHPAAAQKNTEFGYSRKDILLIGGGVFGAGIAAYYGLQAAGLEPGIAGNFVQFGIFVLFCVGWIASYLYRVLNKVCAACCPPCWAWTLSDRACCAGHDIHKAAGCI